MNSSVGALKLRKRHCSKSAFDVSKLPERVSANCHFHISCAIYRSDQQNRDMQRRITATVRSGCRVGTAESTRSCLAATVSTSCRAVWLLCCRQGRASAGEQSLLCIPHPGLVKPCTLQCRADAMHEPVARLMFLHGYCWCFSGCVADDLHPVDVLSGRKGHHLSHDMPWILSWPLQSACNRLLS